MKNSNIISQISKKASQLYQKGLKKGKLFWYDAMRQASKLIKGIKEGVITFWKLPKNEDEDVIPTTRRITTLESIGFNAKTQKEPNGLIKLVDLDKYLSGASNYIISFIK